MMKTWLYTLCYLFSLQAMTIGYASAETLRVGFRSYPPLMMEEDKAGIYFDILQKISERTDLVFEIEFAPPSRSNANFEEGRIDIEPGVNPVWRKSSKLPGEYSIAFSKAEDIILFKPDKLIQSSAAESLKNKQIGVVRGFTYPKYSEHFANGDIERINLKDGPTLVKFFIADRVDYIVINKVAADYWLLNQADYHITRLADYLSYADSVEDLNSVGNLLDSPGTKQVLIAEVIASVDLMLRIHPDKKHILAPLNDALAELLAEGEIDKIFARYR